MEPLRDYIIQNPYNDTALSYLGEIFISEKRFPEAIDTYNRLIDLNPYYYDYYKKIALSYYQLGNFSDDNRAGIERTLHRISALRNRSGNIVGLTCRVGRAIFGTIKIFFLLKSNCI